MAQQYTDREYDPGFAIPGGFRPDDFAGCQHGEAALTALLSGDYSALDAMTDGREDKRRAAA